MGYYPVLDASALLEKHNITSESTSKEQNIEANIKATEKNLTCMLLSWAYNLRYKQLKT